MVVQDMIPFPEDLQRMLDSLKKLLEETERVLVQANSPGEFLFVLLVVALVPAVSEELLFRGSSRETSRRRRVEGPGDHGDHFRTVSFQPVHTCPARRARVYFGFIVYRSGNITLSMSAHSSTTSSPAPPPTSGSTTISWRWPRTRPDAQAGSVEFAIFAVVFVARHFVFGKARATTNPRTILTDTT